MAKINIVFNGSTYSIEESALAEVVAKFETALEELVELSGPSYSEGLTYELVNNVYYRVRGIGSCKDSHVVIPSEYEGLPVAEIGDNAFANRSSLISIVLPDSVIRIEGGAFASCTSLTSIELGNGLKGIGSDVFYENALTTIVFPSSLEAIDTYAIVNCSSLSNIIYKGTTAQWEAVNKSAGWISDVPATYVQCSDGDVAL